MYSQIKFNNMKKIVISLFSIASILMLTQCSTNTEKLCNNADTRGEIISTLMRNDAYMNQVMDSLQTKHSDAMVKSNKQMHENMMNKMTSMCKIDSNMFKMMIDQTLDMCDADQLKNNMMMRSMRSHPKMMESMHTMGNTKMVPNNAMHQH